MDLQFFAEEAVPAAAPTAAPTAEPEVEIDGVKVPVSKVVERLKAAEGRARAETRRAKELEAKHEAADKKLQEATKTLGGLEPAKPFLDNPIEYMTQYLAQDPVALQAVADGVDAIRQGKAPTKAVVAAVGRAAGSAKDPEVAKLLDELHEELKGAKETRQQVAQTQEELQVEADLVSFESRARELGIEFDRTKFIDFAEHWAEEEGLGEEDTVDTRLLFRLYLAEQKAAGKTIRPAPPRLPGSSAPPSAPAQRPKSFDDAEAILEASLRALPRD